MEHPALATASHAAFRVLAIMLVGATPERNGRLMITDSYAAQFGLKSHDTLQRGREELEARGLIVCTRRVQRRMRWPALWAVTWWPINSRDGAPLDRPEPAAFAYLKWPPITPPAGAIPTVEQSSFHPDGQGDAIRTCDCSSPRPSGYITPMAGVEARSHHPDSGPTRATHHPDGRGHSKSLDAGG